MEANCYKRMTAVWRNDLPYASDDEPCRDESSTFVFQVSNSIL